MPIYELIDTFQSSSSSKVYQVKRDLDSGVLSCDCPGWRFMRGDVRDCTHVRVCEQKLGQVTSARAAAIRVNRAQKAHDAAVQAHATIRANKRAAIVPLPAPEVTPDMVLSPFDGIRRRRIILDD